MAVLLAAPILLSITLLVSGLAKLGERRATEDAMTSLRIPALGLHHAAASVLPIAEIVLALGLWIPVVPLQVVIAGLLALLTLAYLVIIARALTFEEQVECSCFGSLASPTVSRATLGRNILLTLAALVTVLVAAAGLLTAVLVQAPLTLVSVGLALVLTILLTVLTLGGTAPTSTTSDGPAAPGEEADEVDEEGLLEYERTEIPAAVLQKKDGSLTTLRKLTYRRAALLLFVTDGCGPCVRVLGQGERWRSEIGELIDIRFVFSRPAEHLLPRTAELAGESVLHDLQFIARDALAGDEPLSSPSAVLLGADGLLAGGPVTGGDAVIQFVDEIVAQIALAQDDGELPRPAQ